MNKHESKLKRAVESTDIAEIVQIASNEDSKNTPDVYKIVAQIRVNKEDVPQWLSILDFILQEEEEQDDDEKWSAHCCKTYMRSEGVFGFVWSITLASRFGLKKPVNDVSRAIRTLSASLKQMPTSTHTNSAVKPSAASRAAQAITSKSGMNYAEPVIQRIGGKIEVTEMPLTGVNENRNKPKSRNGKGASLISGGV